jgi:hypothetical protein
VCPKCYDPPHPQDYIRVPVDRITPAGPTTGETDTTLIVAGTDINGTATLWTSLAGGGAVGSTSNPAGGFEPTGDVSTMPNQAHVTASAISTVTSSTYFPTSVFSVLNNTTYLPTAWAATNLPTGLSISASTGDITGTPTAGASYTNSVTVAVTYGSSGLTYTSNTWSWTITDTGLAPDEITSLTLWWDFSEDEYVWSDTPRTVKILDAEKALGVTDRSGNANHGTVSAGDGGRWFANTRNSLATLDMDTEAGAARNMASSSIGLTPPYTMIGVAQVPVVGASQQSVLLSHSGINGTQWGVASDEQGGTDYVDTITGSVVTDTEQNVGQAWGAKAGEWYMFTLVVDSADGATAVTYSGETAANPFDHDAEAASQATFRIGVGVQGPGAGFIGSWNSILGEAIVYDKALSTAEVDSLVVYMTTKWALTDSI